MLRVAALLSIVLVQTAFCAASPKERRHLLDLSDKINAAKSIAHGGFDYDNVHKLIWGWAQDYNTRRRLLDTPDTDISSLYPAIKNKLNAAASIAHGGLDDENLHKLVWGWKQDYNTRRRLHQDGDITNKIETKANAAVSIAHGGLDDDNLHKLVWGWQQMRTRRRHLQGVAGEG